MKYFYQILVIFFALFLWQIFSNDLIQSPKNSLFALIEIYNDGVLVSGILSSFYRYFIGLIIGLISGILLGFFFGFFKSVASAFDPLISILRPISPIAWVPIVVIIFGIGDRPSIFIIAYAVFFPVLLLASSAVRNVPKELILLSQNFGASKWQIFSGVIFPSSVLTLISSLKLAASLAWINLVVGEMLGAQSGLGYLIIDARNQLKIELVLGLICVIGVLGYLLNLAFSCLEKGVCKRFGYDRNQ